MRLIHGQKIKQLTKLGQNSCSGMSYFLYPKSSICSKMTSGLGILFVLFVGILEEMMNNRLVERNSTTTQTVSKLHH